jgi:hypothetical protein
MQVFQMSTATLPLSYSFSNLFAQVCATNELTLADRYSLQAALLSGEMSEEELGCIDRLLYSIRRGRIKVGGTLAVL